MERTEQIKAVVAAAGAVTCLLMFVFGCFLIAYLDQLRGMHWAVTPGHFLSVIFTAIMVPIGIMCGIVFANIVFLEKK